MDPLKSRPLQQRQLWWNNMDDQSTMNTFDAYICSFCHTKESLNNSKTCSGCKLVSYCCASHQREGWKEHKVFCKAAQQLLKDWNVDDLFKIPPKIMHFMNFHSTMPAPQWFHTRYVLKNLFETLLKRGVEEYEKSLIFYPKHCSVCFTREIKKEFDCTLCFTSYCTLEHKNLDMENHGRMCAELNKVLELELYWHFLDKGLKSVGELPLGLIKPGTVNFNSCDMTSFIADKINPTLAFKEAAFLSFFYTGVLTVSNSISQIPNFEFNNELTIHLVGAQGNYEYVVTKYWENLLHFFPTLKRLRVAHIGPRIMDPFNTEGFVTVCRDCKKKKKYFELQYFPICYHEFYENRRFSKPDLVIAFNNGLFDVAYMNNSWGQSLPFFFKCNAPIILTAWNHREALADIKRLLSLDAASKKKVSVLMHAEENKFKMLAPRKDWYFPTSEVDYRNGYISILIVQ